jgi:uncharacterized membrane protein SpoIIM required for sporulation
MQHHISAIATRAMERWRFLAHEGLARSRTRAKPENIGSVENFTAAYRRSATELARVRAFSPDRQLADYIESSVATAHFAVYKRRRPKVMHAVRGALFHFPGLVRKYWAYHLAAALIFMAAATIAFVAVSYTPDTYNLFISQQFADGRDPSASTEYLRSTLGPQETSLDRDTEFSSSLFVNNTIVSFIGFSFGILLGLPTIYILIKNGLMLGAFTSLFVQRGLGIEYFAWILPHGVPEIGAIFLCCGAGLALGHRILNPGNRPRSTALRLTAQDACLTALGCVPLLAMAGLIEGVFRQSYASTELRYGLFALMLIGLGTWIAFTRRGSRVVAHG